MVGLTTAIRLQHTMTRGENNCILKFGRLRVVISGVRKYLRLTAWLPPMAYCHFYVMGLPKIRKGVDGE